MPKTLADSRLSELFDWIRENLHLTHTVDTLAERALMSRRTFTRQFKLLTGMGFVSWVLVERLAYAQRLLESTSGSIEVVAERTGFGSPESLRLHFRRKFGIAPSEWRKQFRG